MKNKKFFLVICIFLAVTLMFTGCRPARRPVPEEGVPAPTEERQQYDNNLGQPRVMDDPRQEPRNMQPAEIDQDLTIRADRIVEEIVRLDEVRSATVVISDTTAVVGVNLTEDTKGEVNREIERQIEDVVRQTDRNIENVAITADPDLFTRIQNIAREAGRGRPLSGLGTEIEEIIRRITPTT